MTVCVHAERSEEAITITTHGTEPSQGPMLCGWADNAAPGELVSVPRWLQRNALAGHLLKYPQDCAGCPCFQPRLEEVRDL